MSGAHQQSGVLGVGRGMPLSGLRTVTHHGGDTTSRFADAGRGLPDIIHSHNVGHALPGGPALPDQHLTSASPTVTGTRHHRQHHHQGQGREGRRRDGAGQRIPRSRRRTLSATTTLNEDDGCKGPCLKCLTVVTSLRWVLLLLSFVGVLFVVAGIVMAVLHAIGKEFLIYALAFIGLGVILVVVVVVAWRCTPTGSEPIHALCHIGDSQPQPESARSTEHRPRRTRRRRNGHWHGGVLYPEFRYRQPPPSYAASMLASHTLQADVPNTNNNVPLQTNDGYSLPRSSPPSYRSRASTIHSGVHITFPPGRDSAPNSHPPTYRLRPDSHPRPRLPEDFDSPSSPAAPADVAFTGPAMTAETVQRIIGTGHRRQQSAGAAVWHSPSASIDPMFGASTAQHRRVSSMDGRTDSVSWEPGSQANNVSLHLSQGGGTGVNTGNITSLRPDSHVLPSPGVQQGTMQTALIETHTRSAHGLDTTQTRERGRDITYSTSTMATDDQYSEPEVYDTPL